MRRQPPEQDGRSSGKIAGAAEVPEKESRGGGGEWGEKNLAQKLKEPIAAVRNAGF